MVASSSTSDPLFVVVGATGKQGGSVIAHLLASELKFRIRGLSRSPTSATSVELASKGVDVVQASLDSGSDLKRAFNGATYIYGLTDFFVAAGMDPEKEVAMGRLLVQAAAQVEGLKMLYFSSLEGCTKASGGKYVNAIHFDSKQVVADYAVEAKVPTVIIKVAVYLSEFLPGGFICPQKGADDTFIFATPVNPTYPMPTINVHRDLGSFVVAAVENPSKYGPGSEILAASEELSLVDRAAQWSEVTGKKSHVVQIDEATFKSFFPTKVLALDVLDIFRSGAEFGYFSKKDFTPFHKDLKAPAQVWKDFVAEADWSQLFGN